MKPINLPLAILMLFLTLNFAATAQMEITFTASNYNGANVSCFGSQNGSVTVNVIGGTPPYTYLWSNDATTQTISNLAAGYYNVTITDSSGIQAESGMNLEEPKPLEVTLETPKYGNGYNVSCYNCYNGSITTTVFGGTTPYTYEWKDNQSTTQNRTGIKGGVYDLILTDNNGCKGFRQIILTEPERSDWTMAGNANTDPATQYVGTSDNKDLVVKTNGQERMRIRSDGQIEMPSSSHFKTLFVNRITSIDTILYIGDSTIMYIKPTNNLSADQSSGAFNSYKGIGFGQLSYAKGTNSIGMGYNSRAEGNNSLGFGNNLFIPSTTSNSISIGTGVSATDRLLNNSPNSLYIGFNSDIPTVVVTPSNGINTIGKVGIGTTNPSSLLSVGTSSQFQVNNSGAISSATGITSSGAISFSSLGNGMIKSSSGTIQLGVAGTDYQTPLVAGIDYQSPLVPGTDYQVPITPGNGLSFAASTLNSVWTSNNGIIYSNNSGNVGIGTSSPSEKLEIAGNLNVIGNIIASGNNSILTSHDLHVTNKIEVGNSIWLGGSTNGGNDNIYTDDNDLTINGDPNYDYNTILNTNHGNVGIGISSPIGKFEVKENNLGNNTIEILSNNAVPNRRGLSIGLDQGGNGNKDGSFNFWIHEWQNTAGSSAFNFKETHNNTTLMRIQNDGKVIIGSGQSLNTNTSYDYGLYVGKGILTEKVKVAISSTNDWNDKVFSNNYVLKSLSEIESFITLNHHLPEIPSAEEVVISGIDLGSMNSKLLQKIEELTLYAIAQQKQIEEIKKQLNLQTK